MDSENIIKLFEKLINQSREKEWVEFKLNFHNNEEIGQTLSALSNGASLHNQAFGYLIFGVKDETKAIIGTTFRPSSHKKGNEEIEHWLAQRLNPKTDFKIYEFDYNGSFIVILEIQAAKYQPVEFINIAYIRVGSITRQIREFPEKARTIWKKSSAKSFELEIAKSGLTESDIIELINTQAFFELFNLPYPSSRKGVIERLLSERIIQQDSTGHVITNLGAILFAKDLNMFDSLSRKAVRVIIYKGKDKLHTIKDSFGHMGYAVGFQNLVKYINDQLPTNEAIEAAIRKQMVMYPEIAVRELVANALIHQDFNITGSGPVVEIFSDRIEISNPGIPLITTVRFIDEYQSRNELLASVMRRIGICEEKGSGIDKVVFHCEVFQLPAPDFKELEKHTKAILFAPKKLNEMDKTDKVRSCYLHCCLKYVSNEKMTNQSLRERFKIAEKNAAIASRIIKDTVDSGFIKDDDPKSSSKKFAKYIPFWA